MERGSSKHGPRLGGERTPQAETTAGGDARAERWQTEPALAPPADAIDDGSPPGRRPRPAAKPHGITPADVQRRSNLAKWLSDCRFPADRRALLTHAASKAAPEQVLQAVRTLPDERFHNVGEVATALGLGAANHNR